jgi:serine protease Do
MSPSRVFSLAGALLVAIAALPAVGVVRADPLSDEVEAVYQKSEKAVVRIEAQDDYNDLFGTGFFVDSDGTIYTNYSVGGESHNIVVSDGVARYLAHRIAADPRSGVAILKIEAQKTPFLQLGKSSDMAVAAMVVAMGYPLDLPLTPNVGCVGGFDISYGDRFFAVRHIRANVAVQNGEGGAPLLNMEGQVVGILESSLDGGSGCFALPIEAAEKVQSDVVRYGAVRPGWLGIRFDKSSASENQIRVEGFVAGSPAEKSGLQSGDVILKVGDRSVSTVEDVMDAAFYLTAGEEAPITILRNGQTMQVKLTPTANPAVPDETGPEVTGINIRLGN